MLLKDNFKHLMILGVKQIFIQNQIYFVLGEEYSHSNALKSAKNQKFV